MQDFSSYLDYLYNWLLPHSLLYGMTAEQFWYDEPSLFFSYEKAYILRLEQQQEYDNYVLWLGGQYQMAAISQSLATKKVKIYPQKPLELKKDNQIAVADKMEMRKLRAKQQVELFKQRKAEKG